MRHPAVAVLGAAAFGAAALWFGRGALDIGQQFAAAGDPAAISNLALDRIFDRDVAEREVRSALAAADPDLAQSFLDLAADRNVAVDPRLVDQVRDAHAQAASATGTAGRFARGLWTGEPSDLASFAGTAVGDLFVFGDIRDAAREGTHYLTGQPVDPWILGLAGAGIAITAGTYVSLGLGAPERFGLSVIKAARRTGRLNPALLTRVAREAVKTEKAGGIVELAGGVGRIESKAGAQAALDGLAVAEEPADVSRLARLSAVNGGKTRAIVKLLGRAALVLAVSAFDVAWWMLGAVFMLLGFASSAKSAVDRMTWRYLQRKKVRRARARAAEVRALAVPRSRSLLGTTA
jgi:hypothetical protein